MSAFVYEAARPDGAMISGSMEAASREAVRAELRRRRLYPVEIRPSSTAREERGRRLESIRAALRWRGDPTLEFTRELATLVGAGFSLDRALGLLGEVVEDPRIGGIATGLRRRVREGERLSEALRGEPDVFPSFYVHLVAAGEESGALERVLERLTEYLEERRKLREEISSALVYPAVMTVVGGASILVLLVLVIPQFVSILEESGRGPPLATALLVSASGLVARFWWLLAILTVAGVVVARMIRRTPEGQVRLDALDLGLPLWGSLRRDILASRFCRTLAILLESGVPLLRALGSATRTVTNRVAAAALERAGEDVRRGQPLGAALEDHGAPFPRLAIRMIRLGEESGELETMLERVAEVTERRVRRTTSRLVSLLEPALILAFALVVGFVALAMLQAVFSVQQVPI